MMHCKQIWHDHDSLLIILLEWINLCVATSAEFVTFVVTPEINPKVSSILCNAPYLTNIYTLSIPGPLAKGKFILCNIIRKKALF